MTDRAEQKSIRFLEIYDQLDRYMRTHLSEDHPHDQDDAHSALIRKLAKRNPIFKKYKYDLLSFARLRNSIVHHPQKKLFDPIAEPHDEVLALYEDLLKEVTEPDLAMSIAVPRDKMHIAFLNDKVLPTMRHMSKNHYSSVPILNQGDFVGVFSERVMFQLLADMEHISIEDDMTFQTLEDYLALDQHDSDTYLFLPKTVSIVELDDLFANAIDGDKRIKAVYLTENGKSSEYILGMVTAWDLVGIEEVEYLE